MSFDLLIGGVRSGKSRLAVRLGELAGGLASEVAGEPAGRSVTMIATAEALDDDMARRIAVHRAERPDSWSTIEEPRALADAISRVEPASFVIVDCLTVWTSNLLLAEVPDADLLGQAETAAALLAAHPGGGVVVTNEVGMGVHPSSPLGRRYRDVLGAVNVRFGSEADRVGLVVAGRVLPLASADEWVR